MFVRDLEGGHQRQRIHDGCGCPYVCRRAGKGVGGRPPSSSSSSGQEGRPPAPPPHPPTDTHPPTHPPTPLSSTPPPIPTTFFQVCERTAADKKGGHLAIRKSDGKFMLRESAMCPDTDKAAFEDISKHKWVATVLFTLFYFLCSVWVCFGGFFGGGLSGRVQRALTLTRHTAHMVQATCG